MCNWRHITNRLQLSLRFECVCVLFSVMLAARCIFHVYNFGSLFIAYMLITLFEPHPPHSRRLIYLLEHSFNVFVVAVGWAHTWIKYMPNIRLQSFLPCFFGPSSLWLLRFFGCTQSIRRCSFPIQRQQLTNFCFHPRKTHRPIRIYVVHCYCLNLWQ